MLLEFSRLLEPRIKLLFPEQQEQSHFHFHRQLLFLVL